MLGAPSPQGNVPALTTPTRRGPPGVLATIGPPLSPVQVVAIPVADAHVPYLQDVAARLRAEGVRVEVDASDAPGAAVDREDLA